MRIFIFLFPPYIKYINKYEKYSNEIQRACFLKHCVIRPFPSIRILIIFITVFLVEFIPKKYRNKIKQDICRSVFPRNASKKNIVLTPVRQVDFKADISGMKQDILMKVSRPRIKYKVVRQVLVRNEGNRLTISSNNKCEIHTSGTILYTFNTLQNARVSNVWLQSNLALLNLFWLQDYACFLNSQLVLVNQTAAVIFISSKNIFTPQAKLTFYEKRTSKSLL